MVKKQEVVIVSAQITLAQFLKWANLVENGAEAKNNCRAGLVFVNGIVCREPGKKLQLNDEVGFFGAVYMPVWSKPDIR